MWLITDHFVVTGEPHGLVVVSGHCFYHFKSHEVTSHLPGKLVSTGVPTTAELTAFRNPTVWVTIYARGRRLEIGVNNGINRIGFGTPSTRPSHSISCLVSTKNTEYLHPLGVIFSSFFKKDFILDLASCSVKKYFKRFVKKAHTGWFAVRKSTLFWDDVVMVCLLRYPPIQYQWPRF